MKYRIRRIGKRRLPASIKKKRLRLRGIDTLRKRPPLPEPIEAIRLEDDTRRAPFSSLRLIRLIKSFFLQLISELRAAARISIRLIKKFRRRIANFISNRLAEKRAKKINSLPILFGAALSSFLVCVITASYIIFSLLIPYSREYSSVRIPDLKGMRLEDISLESGSFNLIVQYENNPDVEDGKVISQIPAAGVTRKIYGSDSFCPISVKVSRHAPLSVPSELVGVPLRDAALSLLRDGILYTVKEKYSEDKKGTVIGCSPAEGKSLSAGERVTLTVSLGSKELYTSVPSLVGLTESEAMLRIRSSSLSIGEVTYVRSDKKIGTVIAQSPSPYTTEKQGQGVSFTVSAGAEFSVPTVPDLYGMTKDQAERALYGVGLTVSAVYSIASGAKAQTVISQSPIAGTPITPSVTSVVIHLSN